jgi:ATP-dependent RNA helicase DHX37/DHR1
MADLEDDAVDNDDDDMDDGEGATSITLFEDNITDENVKEQGRKSLKKLNATTATKLRPLPLYSMLSPSDQLKVFEPATAGTRLCVIATNVAETSLTIPGVRYVLDTGRVKEKVFDRTTGVSRFVIGWTSQASADQRAGRAGRTGPGHCYRLYSSAVFDQQFQKFTDPDILRTPVDGVVLQMKSLGIGDVARFPFPTPPDRGGLESAVRSLTHIGALSVPTTTRGTLEDAEDYRSTIITDVGRSMNQFPLNPRYAKMLLMATQEPAVLPHVIAIVAALTVKQMFLHDSQMNAMKQKEEEKDEEEIEKETKVKKAVVNAKKQWVSETSDVLSMLRAVGAYEFANEDDHSDFCKRNMLHEKNMKEVKALHHQLAKLVAAYMKDKTNEDSGAGDNAEEYEALDQITTDELTTITPPSTEQEIAIRQIVCSGLVDQVARMATAEELRSFGERFDSGYFRHNRPYVALSLGKQRPVFIHPSSYLYGKQPEYIVFDELNTSKSDRTYMKIITTIRPEWLVEFARPPMLRMSKPLENPGPRYDRYQDTVICHVKPTIVALELDGDSSSSAQWDLPTSTINFDKAPHMTQKEREAASAKYFGKAFLEGRVFKDLKVFESKLVSPVGDMLLGKSKRAQDFAQKLASRNVTSREQLLAIWRENKDFLKREYLGWLKPDSQKQVVWPPRK